MLLEIESCAAIVLNGRALTARLCRGQLGGLTDANEEGRVRLGHICMAEDLSVPMCERMRVHT